MYVLRVSEFKYHPDFGLKAFCTAIKMIGGFFSLDLLIDLGLHNQIFFSSQTACSNHVANACLAVKLVAPL